MSTLLRRIAFCPPSVKIKSSNEKNEFTSLKAKKQKDLKLDLIENEESNKNPIMLI